LNQEQLFLPRKDLDLLLLRLREEGYRCLGPVVRDGAIQYLPVSDSSDLPAGVELTQAPASYQLRPGDGDRLFNWSNGPQALKPLLFTPGHVLWQVQHDASGRLEFTGNEEAVEATAVIGVRPCDLSALELQDRHFLAPGVEDPHYKKRRDSLLLIGVDCSHPADTCFCASTGDGPDLTAGFDIGMSELDEGFLLRMGTTRGWEVVKPMGLDQAAEIQQQQAAVQNEQARIRQKKKLPDADIQKLLLQRPGHPHWQHVAERCTACGSCTSVCPTCFCFSEHAGTSLDGAVSSQLREWSSCFVSNHSFFHGQPVRVDIASRYRQWLTHKLAGWQEQFGRSGCVGCGRCISWCPVGIDLTREVAKLVQDEL
jgi:sulfhydrogenase subunit beta (sulfur reductase)